jgi:hypothetical protein
MRNSIFVAVALALGVAACGGSSGGGQFAWLRPGSPPAAWPAARIPSGAVMSYPSVGWRQIRGDPGTATAAVFDSENRYLGYLNVTPRQGDESLSTWASFRVAHNAHEGDRHVIRVAVGRGLRFRTGRGSCVQDAYTTQTGIGYTEIACLVAGTRATSVIVGAAPTSHWAAIAPTLHRAISAFTT